MNNTINYSRLIKNIVLVLLFIALILQFATALLLETKLEIIEELHEVIGFSFFGLILVHIVLYWKNIKALFLTKTHK